MKKNKMNFWRRDARIKAGIEAKQQRRLVPSGQWMRDEIAIMEGRKSFTPDVTMAKGEPDLGPVANSVVQDHK